MTSVYFVLTDLAVRRSPPLLSNQGIVDDEILKDMALRGAWAWAFSPVMISVLDIMIS